VLIDFAGGDLDGLNGTQQVKAQITAENAQIEALSVQRIPENGAWRVTFVMTPRAKRPVDMRCFLTLFGEVMTETWVEQWIP
jgi:glucans biosynthesis protein